MPACKKSPSLIVRVLLLFVFWGSLSYAPTPAEDDIYLYPHFDVFMSGGKVYTILELLRTSEFPFLKGTPAKEAEQIFFRKILLRAQEWNKERLKQKADEYNQKLKPGSPPVSPEFFDEMFKQHPLLDGQSNYLLVFEGIGLSKPAGMIRFTAPDPKTGHTAGENYLDYVVPRDPEKAGAKPRGTPYTTGRTLWAPELRNVPQEVPYEDKEGWRLFAGTWGAPKGKQTETAPADAYISTLFEIKSLVVGDGLEADLIPLMFYQAEISMLSNSISHSKPGDIGPGTNPAFRPYAYILFCDEELVPYYRDKLKFRLLQNKPVKGRSYAFILTREEYLERVFDALKARRGFSFLRDADRNSTLSKELWRFVLDDRFDILESTSLEEMFGVRCARVRQILASGRKRGKP